MLRCDVRQILQYKQGNGGVEPRLRAGREYQFDLGIAGNTRSEIGRSGIVHRNRNGTKKQASPESSDPFSRVGRPEQDTIVYANSSGFKAIREEHSVCSQLVVAPGSVLIAACRNESAIAPEAIEIGEQGDKRIARHRRLKSLWTKQSVGSACPIHHQEKARRMPR